MINMQYAEVEIAATVGFKVETFSKSKIDFTVFDMSGQSKYRSLWEQYYEEAEAIIFVIDSADRLRIKVAQNELENLLDHQGKQVLGIINSLAIKKRTIPILFFANKMDLGQAMTEAEVAKEMQLHLITDRPWHIQSSSATEGFGVEEGISWMSEIIKKNK